MLTYFVAFDMSRPPFDDPCVRGALVLATDRETLANTVAGLGAVAATGGFIAPAIPGHCAGSALPYDPEGARLLLADAGYPGGRGFPSIEALRSEGPAQEDEFEYFEAQWRENLGIGIVWEFVDWPVLSSRIRENPPHMWWVGWNPDYSDPDSFLRVGLTVRRAWQHAAYEDLVEQARRLTDQGERMRLYREAERILAREAPIMPVYYHGTTALVKPWVKNVPGYWKDVIIEAH
jgi:oligopeptide transport system substrate-binding protein